MDDDVLVLWDIDGTLLNAGGVGRDLYHEVFAELFGRPLEACAPMAGRTDRAIILQTLTMAGVAEPRRYVDPFIAGLGAHAPALRAAVAERGEGLPGAAEALAALAAASGTAARVPVITYTATTATAPVTVLNLPAPSAAVEAAGPAPAVPATVTAPAAAVLVSAVSGAGAISLKPTLTGSVAIEPSATGAAVANHPSPAAVAIEPTATGAAVANVPPPAAVAIEPTATGAAVANVPPPAAVATEPTAATATATATASSSGAAVATVERTATIAAATTSPVPAPAAVGTAGAAPVAVGTAGVNPVAVGIAGVNLAGVTPGDATGTHADGRPRRLHQSVLTGNIRLLAEVKLAALGLRDGLDLCIGAYGDDHEDRTELIQVSRRRAAAVHGRSANAFAGAATVVIGDTPLDVAAALAAGARAVAVASGAHSATELHAAGAYAVLRDLTDTELVLEALFG